MNEKQITGDYHTHTQYSHGKGTIEDNVQAALLAGLKEVAITDHGLGHIIRGLNHKKVLKSRQIVDRLNIELKGRIKVLLGIEANIISLEGAIDLKEDMWDYFDLVLVGYHPVALVERLSDIFKMYLRNAVSGKLKSLIETNTEALVHAMELHKIDILSHPGYMMPVDIREVARAAVRTGTLLEINAKHAILRAEQIRIAAEEGARFILCSDAHQAGDVANFAEAIKSFVASGVSVDRLVNYEGSPPFTTRNGLVFGGGC